MARVFLTLLQSHSTPRLRRVNLLIFPVLVALSSPTVRSGEIEYNRDIRPILADKCFACHGPDKGNRQAELRLDTVEGALATLSSDANLAAVRPGDPEHSEVYRRITALSDDEKMPPAETRMTLTPQEIDVIRQWIEQGARYQPHWAFLAPHKSSLPATQNDSWVKNEIDAFVLEQMREHGLAPNSPATKEHLIRRVTFDLTGLPPTLAEIDAFLADDSAEAFERVVDRLLASERFGERMTSEWLDVARYSDTYGFQVDHGRFVWPWRDWVIRAFNRDLPYDEFLTEQLAGDLLPDATQEQILATTFCRLHPQEAEGGSIPEEYRIGYVSDRLQTFSTAFLGLTIECCKCHDHKYDPLSQREYFQLASFFDNINESGLYSFFTSSVPTPTLLLADEAAQKTMQLQNEKIQQAEQTLQQLAAENSPAFANWRSQLPALPEVWPGEIKRLDFAEVQAPNAQVAGPGGRHAVELTGDDAIGLDVGNFHRYEPFSVALWMSTPDHKDRAVIFHRTRAWTDAGSRGYELLLLDGRLSAALVHFDPGNCIRVQTRDPFPTGDWHHVAITYDGSSRAGGLKIFIDGVPAELETIADALTKDITGGGGDNITIGERFRDHGFTRGRVADFRVYSRELIPLEVAELHDGHSLRDAWGAAVDDPRKDPLHTYYLAQVDEPSNVARATLQERRKTAAEFVETIPEIMVMREKDQPTQTYLLERGEYALRKEPVSSGTPEVFPPFPDDLPRDRLGLARWMTSPEHPLTARVAVNRYWQLIFGTGLVRTTEDMGNQGEWPTHPELLDWLACDFREHGWSVKRLLKQLVCSATYQQSALVSAEKEAIDPANRWLSRAMSERFTAEMLRDNALAVSGLLVDRIGGAPAKPYEVEAAFKPLARDTGEGLYRRSLYTYWSRTGPAPAMMALDAAKRDVCQVRRERTLSPLQPLVLLNGPQFVESARVLAERVLKAHPPIENAENQNEVQLREMFRWTTSRQPTDEELQVIRKLLEQYQRDFADHPEHVTAFLAVGDHARDETLDAVQLAALAEVANLLLNYDECVFRR